MREAVAEQPEMGDVARGALQELLPAVAESLTPPEGADATVLGALLDELRRFAVDALSRRMELIGVPFEDT